jgi:hypothetical protein
MYCLNGFYVSSFEHLFRCLIREIHYANKRSPLYIYIPNNESLLRSPDFPRIYQNGLEKFCILSKSVNDHSEKTYLSLVNNYSGSMV